MEPLLLTIRQAQVVLSVGRNTMYNLIKSKEIPSVKIGRSIRINKQALEDWVTKQDKG